MAQVGRTLVFNKAFASTDPQFGGTIKVPAYTYATSLALDTDEVPVDVPQWLVVMTAAEYVRNDITRQSQYPNLIQEANQLMERMKSDNDSQVEQVLRPWGAAGANW